MLENPQTMKNVEIHYAPRGTHVAFAQRSPDAFFVHQFSPCTNPVCTNRHSRTLFFSLPPSPSLSLSPVGFPWTAPVLSWLLHAQRSPKSFLVHQVSPCTNPPSTKRHSLFTKSRHARIHYAPTGIQGSPSLFTKCTNRPSTNRGIQ